MNDMDPRWTAPIYTNTSGQDFLGLRAVQASLMEYLMPGITTITPRARYYPFYAWLLVEYGDSHPPEMSLAAFIKHREQIFVLANLAWADASDDISTIGGLQGSGKLSNHWEAYREASSVPLTVDDYLKARRGGFDSYAGVVQDLGIIRWQESGTLDILPKGLRLADSFADAISETEYYHRRREFDQVDAIPKHILVDYGRRCHLGGLAVSPDRLPTLETLLAFQVDETLPNPDASQTALGNMKGTLGLILHMLDQAQDPFGEDAFRETTALGSCIDYVDYEPAEPLRPFLAHWQMHQLREYYVFALYALWTHFLYWLRLEGPATFERFRAYLSEVLNPAESAVDVGLAVSSRSSDQWRLGDWLTELLNACDINEGDWTERCHAFSQQSQMPLNEHSIYQRLDQTERSDAARYVGLSWLILSALYLRLLGLREVDRWNSWYWARKGGSRRRSLHLFVDDLTRHVASGDSVLDTLTSLYRDYIISQHTITVLEKWRQRNSNTFHFTCDEGLFDWVRDDDTGFSGHRFRQAYDMLADLGLYEIDSVAGAPPRLTDLGRATLQRVLEACSD